MAQNQYYNFLPAAHHTRVIPHWLLTFVNPPPQADNFVIPKAKQSTKSWNFYLWRVKGGKRGCKEVCNRLKPEQQVLPAWEVQGENLVKSAEVLTSNWEVPKWRKSSFSQILYKTSQEHEKEENYYAVHFKPIKSHFTIIPSPHSPEISNLGSNWGATRKTYILCWICTASSTKRLHLKTVLIT